MVEVRKGETGVNIPNRSPRVFQKADGFWYFLTREKTEVGPFATDEAASAGVADYAGFSQDADRVYLDDLDVPVGDGLVELLSRQANDEIVSNNDDLPGERILDSEETADQRKARLYSSRIFLREGSWYFFTREGRDIGPFVSRDAAEAGIVKYVEFAGDLDRVIKTLQDLESTSGSPQDEFF